jgi:hypothetical protein
MLVLRMNVHHLHIWWEVKVVDILKITSTTRIDFDNAHHLHLSYYWFRIID